MLMEPEPDTLLITLITHLIFHFNLKHSYVNESVLQLCSLCDLKVLAYFKYISREIHFVFFLAFLIN